MKFTIVFTTLLCVSTSWAVLAKVEDPKDKREASGGYGTALSSHNYQGPVSHGGDASAISVGAGYSIGGAKPIYSFGGQGSGGALQYQQEGLSPSGHATIQLAPITLQSNHGGQFAAGDLSQIMNQLSHSLNAGGLSLQPSTAVAEFHQTGSEGGQAQELAIPQYSYAAPNLQQYTQQYNLPESLSNAQSYSAGTKGLGTYSTGPVLFNPESQSNAAAAFAYSAPSSGQSLGDASGISLGGSSHGLNGFSFGGSGSSLGGAYKQLGASYAAPSKNSFKPSAFLGASVQGDSGHGLSSLSGSYSAPSFGGFRGGSHGLSFGSAGGHGGASFGGSSGGFGSGSIKYAAPSYQSSKSEGGFGSQLEGLSSLSSGHAASPPGTTYGFPTASYSANSAHAAASSTKPYYVSTKHHHHSSPSSFSEGSSSFRGPVSGHSSLSSFSSGPKYSFGGSSSHYLPKDTQGAYSETSYNTIKYSEELKPRAH